MFSAFRKHFTQPSPARPGIPARANGETSCAGPFLLLFLIDHGIKLTEGEFQSDLGGEGAGPRLDESSGTWGPECQKEGLEQGGLPFRVVTGSRGWLVLFLNCRLAQAGETQGKHTDKVYITAS